MTSLSGTFLTLATPGERFLDLPNNQDSHAGTTQVAAVEIFG